MTAEYRQRLERRQQFARKHGLALPAAVVHDGTWFWQHPEVVAARAKEHAAYQHRAAKRLERQHAVVWRLVRAGFAPVRFLHLADGRPMRDFRAALGQVIPDWERWLAAPWRRPRRINHGRVSPKSKVFVTSAGEAPSSPMRAAFEHVRRNRSHRGNLCGGHHYQSSRPSCNRSCKVVLVLLCSTAGLLMGVQRILATERKLHGRAARAAARVAARAHRNAKRRSGKVVPRVIGGTNTSGAPVTREPVVVFDGPSKRNRRP